MLPSSSLNSNAWNGSCGNLSASAPVLRGRERTKVVPAGSRNVNSTGISSGPPSSEYSKVLMSRSCGEFVLAKPMAVGSMAVGLFNLGDNQREVGVSWQDLGIVGRRRARDVWRQKDAGAVVGEYQALVAPHGVALVRLFR